MISIDRTAKNCEIVSNYYKVFTENSLRFSNQVFIVIKKNNFWKKKKNICIVEDELSMRADSVLIHPTGSITFLQPYYGYTNYPGYTGKSQANASYSGKSETNASHSRRHTQSYENKKETERRGVVSIGIQQNIHKFFYSSIHPSFSSSFTLKFHTHQSINICPSTVLFVLP